MAKINEYGNDSNITSTDRLLGSNENGETKNFTLGKLAEYCVGAVIPLNTQIALSNANSPSNDNPFATLLDITSPPTSGVYIPKLTIDVCKDISDTSYSDAGTIFITSNTTGSEKFLKYNPTIVLLRRKVSKKSKKRNTRTKWVLSGEIQQGDTHIGQRIYEFNFYEGTQRYQLERMSVGLHPERIIKITVPMLVDSFIKISDNLKYCFMKADGRSQDITLSTDELIVEKYNLKSDFAFCVRIDNPNFISGGGTNNSYQRDTNQKKYLYGPLTPIKLGINRAKDASSHVYDVRRFMTVLG